MLRHILPIAASAVVVGYAPYLQQRVRFLRYALVLVLGGAAILSIAHYTDFGRWPSGHYLNGYEFFHYYLGSKYPEVGYTGLYEAALVADKETGLKFHNKQHAIRNLSAGNYITVEKVLARADVVKSHFAKARWEEFRKDVDHFKRMLSQSTWNSVLRDKGYNGTPAWSLIAGAFSKNIPTSSSRGMLLLALLDPILMTIAVTAVWWTFGYRVAMLMIVLVGTHMAMSHSHMKGAFLRTDWAVSLVLAVCALKRGRPALAGTFGAYATVARLFPVLFAFGMGAKFLFEWVWFGRPRLESWRFCAAFTLTCVVLFGLPSLIQGASPTKEFASKIEMHNDSFHPWRIGFKHVFLGAYEYPSAGTGTFQQVFHDRRVAWYVIQAGVLLLCGWLVQRMPDHEALAFGFVPVFFWFAPTYYYYIMLVIPFLYLISRMESPINAFGVVWLLLSSNIAYLLHDKLGRHLILFYTLSQLVLALCVIMLLDAVVRWCRHELGPVSARVVHATNGP